MTRINLVEVETLSDQHLLAEYRELPRMASFANKTTKHQKDIPVSFTLNTGHMTFFLDKAEFLEERHQKVTQELLKRKVSLNNPEKFVMVRNARFQQKQWKPTTPEISISQKRIQEKLDMKPKFYRWSQYG